KVKGPDLETIEAVSLQLETLLKEVPGVLPAAVIADRIVGKPYLEIELDRLALAHYGISIARAQETIEVALGGMPVTRTVEGRERYSVRVRYQRELRDSIESLREILISGSGGEQIPLGYLAEIKYERGPEMIKSEDTFLVGYVLFDKHPGFAEVDVVENCQQYLRDKIAAGELVIPAGVSYVFAGTYENQLRAQKTLAVVIPLSLLIIFLILYMQFKSVLTSCLVFMGIIVAWSGGFIMIWLYSQSWFLDLGIPGLDLRELFQIAPINLSVAVWVGFMALFGIASDDGVVMCSYLEQVFKGKTFTDRAAVRASVILAGRRRVRPCLMTTATTILALVPVLTSTGRGSDIMIPMAIPVFGGMIIEVLTMLTVPELYSVIKETAIIKADKKC
ncbi:MAG: efflux RND transporter permease subunit, partial [Sedimentisphaerales bacterium]|nr:efflux RND transporter permease subunit [Sedimentisphaerales bacterium]